MKKNKNRSLKITLAISLLITVCLLFLSIFLLLFPDSPLFYEPDYEESEYLYYNLEAIQNQTDHSFKIEVLSEPVNKLGTKNAYLTMDRLIETETSSKLTMDDYKQTRVFIKQYQYYSYEFDRTPVEINVSINFLTSITYFDADNDDYISKGDYFILTIKDLDSNESINIIQYEYEKIDFRINTDENESCGFIILNKRPPETNDLVASSDSVSPRAPVCLLLFVLWTAILASLQAYFLLRLYKSKKQKQL